MSTREMGAPTVLVVDDDPVTLQLMDMFLSYVGYQPLLCSEARDALAMIRQHQPNLVTLDLRMGGDPEAGWTILVRMRQDPTTTHIPAIMCSANAAWLEARAPRLRAQGCDVLAKPFDLKVLLGKIAELIESPPALPVEEDSHVPTLV